MDIVISRPGQVGEIAIGASTKPQSSTMGILAKIRLKDDSIVNAVVALIGIALLAVGIVAIAAPEIAAVMFGVPIQGIQARIYVWATATRDIAIGCWFLALLGLRVHQHVLGASLAVVALIPLGDCINVYLNARTSTTALLLHGGSTIAFLVFGVWLWRAR